MLPTHTTDAPWSKKYKKCVHASHDLNVAASIVFKIQYATRDHTITLRKRFRCNNKIECYVRYVIYIYIFNMYFITLFREALYSNRSQRKPMHQHVLSPRRLFFRFPFVLDKKQNGHTAEFLIAASLAVKAGGKFEVDVHLKYQRKYIQLPDSHRRSRTNLCALLCTLLYSKKKVM